MSTLRQLFERARKYLGPPAPPIVVQIDDAALDRVIQRVDVQAGDMLIITMPPATPDVNPHQTRRAISEFLTPRLPPGVHLVIFENGYRTEVIKGADPSALPI